MAGAKETPRNKLIALMYLVFITMLALNVSKEVLVGFGQIFEKVTQNNISIDNSNDAYYKRISDLADKQPDQWEGNNITAQKVKKASDEYYDFLENIKLRATEKIRVDDPELTDYQKMDKGDDLNSILFSPEGISDEGKLFVDKMNEYKSLVIRVFASKYPQYTSLVEQRFENGEYDSSSEFGVVVDKEGIKIPWLKYHFEGFPLVSSLAKITFLQNSIRSTENDVLNALLGRTLTESNEVNEENYITLLKMSKGAYYQGEIFDGNVILGRKAGAAKPNDVDLQIDGKKIREDQFEKIPGGIALNINSGAPGDHQITGNLIFEGEKGKVNQISVDQTFSVISKPNSAVISADKMNVVYRGVDNPMTISIPGIAPSKVNAVAPGLKKIKGSKFIMNPGKGRELTITASGKLPDGQTITTKTKYRIKDLPRPSATFFRQTGSIRLPKSSIEKSRVGAIMEDFDFDLTLNVLEFKIKIPGSPTITCKGVKLSDRAKQALSKARKGSVINIFDLKVQNPAKPNYRFKRVAGVSIEII